MSEIDNGDVVLGRAKMAENERLDAIYEQCEVEAEQRTADNRKSFISAILCDFRRMREALFQELCGDDERADRLRHDCAHLVTALIAGGQNADANIEHAITLSRSICTIVAAGVADIEAVTVSADELFDKRD